MHQTSAPDQHIWWTFEHKGILNWSLTTLLFYGLWSGFKIHVNAVQT